MLLREGMDSGNLDQLLKDYLEARFGLPLDHFVIEGRMSPGTNGDVGLTGNYRKKAGDKNIFFTMTVNLDSGKITNLQGYG
jgi:hypothetical protein